MGRKFKIVVWYGFGLACLILHHTVANSEYIKALLLKSKRIGVDTAFGIYSMIGLVQFTLLIVGILIPLILTIILLKLKTSSRN